MYIFEGYFDLWPNISLSLNVDHKMEIDRKTVTFRFAFDYVKNIRREVVGS